MYLCNMRPQKLSEQEILTGLAGVFRSKGYEGASLADLAEATGLKKASLYHRFPNGKKQMAEAVFSYLGQSVEEHVFRTLHNTQDTPQIRLKKGLSQVRAFYDGGNEVCLFRALSMQAGLALFVEQIETGMKEWIAAFEEIGLALQFSPEVAKEHALQTLVDIQGSLILTKGLNNANIFDRTLENIEKRYLSS